MNAGTAIPGAQSRAGGQAATRGEAFLARLRAGDVLLADGATGTMLQRRGLAAGTAPEVWLFDRPDQIRALHQGYLEAGSDVILSCSFGGTAYRLAGHGLGDRVEKVNRRAAELACEAAAAAGGRAFVAGDMGPSGQLLAPLGKATVDELTEAFARQAAGLAAGGADFLLVETMSDLAEARAAVSGARRVTDLPIVCSFSFDTHRRTMMGVRPEQAARTLGPLVDVIGANCGRDPAEYEGIIQAMRAALPGAPVWAKPNAGLPRMEDGQTVYDATPDDMAQVARRLRAAGAQVIGGCCGTTPEHIAAMAQALRI